MKALAVRLFTVVATLAVMAVLSAAAAKAVKSTRASAPDSVLVLLSTTDVKGKTSPCG